jgi:hypothetical protein
MIDHTTQLRWILILITSLSVQNEQLYGVFHNYESPKKKTNKQTIGNVQTIEFPSLFVSCTIVKMMLVKYTRFKTLKYLELLQNP